MPACPKCDNTTALPVSFTWWGGFLGPKLFSVVKCANCNTQYNSKTGRPSTRAIVIYTIVGVVIVLGLLIALTSL